MRQWKQKDNDLEQIMFANVLSLLSLCAQQLWGMLAGILGVFLSCHEIFQECSLE